MADDRCVRCKAPLHGGGYVFMGERYCCHGCSEGEGCVCADHADDEPK